MFFFVFFRYFTLKLIHPCRIDDDKVNENKKTTWYIQIRQMYNGGKNRMFHCFSTEIIIIIGTTSGLSAFLSLTLSFTHHSFILWIVWFYFLYYRWMKVTAVIIWWLWLLFAFISMHLHSEFESFWLSINVIIIKMDYRWGEIHKSMRLWILLSHSDSNNSLGSIMRCHRRQLLSFFMLATLSSLRW